MQDTFDDILKAQVIYKKMVACTEPQEFKKVFSEAIGRHSLDEFYPVVVRAELSAILAMSHSAQANDRAFDYESFVSKTFGLQPKHLVSMGTQAVADIMETDQKKVEDMFRALGYTVDGGKVTQYGDRGASAKVVQLSERRRAAG